MKWLHLTMIFIGEVAASVNELAGYGYEVAASDNDHAGNRDEVAASDNDNDLSGYVDEVTASDNNLYISLSLHIYAKLKYLKFYRFPVCF